MTTPDFTAPTPAFDPRNLGTAGTSALANVEPTVVKWGGMVTPGMARRAANPAPSTTHLPTPTYDPSYVAMQQSIFAQQNDAAAAAANAGPANQDAMAIIQSELNQWGLGALATQAWGWITSGQGIDQIIQNIRSTPEYASRYPGMALRQTNGLPAISEAQYNQYIDSVYNSAQAAGLPKGFISTDEIGQLIGNDVSAAEMDNRITKGYEAAQQAPLEVKQTLANWGIDTGHLAAYYLDPTKSMSFLTQQLQAAQVAGSSVRTGYGSIDQATATQLAQLGVTQAQADKGFSDLARSQQLFTPLPGQAGAAIGQGVQLGAEFEQNAADLQQVQAAADRQTALFKGGGAFGATTTGLTGTGQAREA